MDRNTIVNRILIYIPLLLSLTVHEWAHAYSAYRLGDDTAQKQGRLTLNPIPHIDLWGTLILPLLGVPFGWAKPVPVDPSRFRRNVNPKTGMMITSAAGPLSNLSIALLCAVVFGLAFRFEITPLLTGAPRHLLQTAIFMNIGLAIFNLLPIPPLDGSRVVEGFLPYRFRPAWEQFQRFSGIVLLAVIFLGTSLLAGPMNFVGDLIVRFIGLVAGR